MLASFALRKPVWCGQAGEGAGEPGTAGGAVPGGCAGGAAGSGRRGLHRLQLLPDIGADVRSDISGCFGARLIIICR